MRGTSYSKRLEHNAEIIVSKHGFNLHGNVNTDPSTSNRRVETNCTVGFFYTASWKYCRGALVVYYAIFSSLNWFCFLSDFFSFNFKSCINGGLNADLGYNVYKRREVRNLNFHFINISCDYLKKTKINSNGLYIHVYFKYYLFYIISYPLFHIFAISITSLTVIFFYI